MGVRTKGWPALMPTADLARRDRVMKRLIPRFGETERRADGHERRDVHLRAERLQQSVDPVKYPADLHQHHGIEFLQGFAAFTATNKQEQR